MHTHLRVYDIFLGVPRPKLAVKKKFSLAIHVIKSPKALDLNFNIATHLFSHSDFFC